MKLWFWRVMFDIVDPLYYWVYYHYAKREYENDTKPDWFELDQ